MENSTILNAKFEDILGQDKIKKDLNEKGKPIPENDIWIAAFTKSYKQILVSNDDHFSYINDLEIFNWK